MSSTTITSISKSVEKLVEETAWLRQRPSSQVVPSSTQIAPGNNDKIVQPSVFDNQIKHLKHDDDTVGRGFYPVMLAMKYFGIFPAEILNQGRHYAPAKPLTILVTFISSVLVTFWTLVWTMNRGLDIGWPIRVFPPLMSQQSNGNLTTSSQDSSPAHSFFSGVTYALQIILPIATLVSGHFTFFRVRTLVLFLNTWREFLKQFNELFSQYYEMKMNLKQHRRYYAFVFISPLFGISLLATPYIAESKVILSGVYGSFFGMAFTVTMIEVMIGITLMCNVKDFLCLAVLEICYRELRHGIEAQYDALQDKITTQHVRSWLKMITFIREQRTRLEKHFGIPNLWFLFEIFLLVLLVLTATVFVLMHGLYEDSLLVTVYIAVSTFAITFLFWKGHLAESVSEQEDLLAESIVQMTECNDCETRLEMKSICDMVFHDPIKITLGIGIVLNKRLILAFCSQLAASLVILLQFVNH